MRAGGVMSTVVLLSTTAVFSLPRAAPLLNRVEGSAAPCSRLTGAFVPLDLVATVFSWAVLPVPLDFTEAADFVEAVAFTAVAFAAAPLPGMVIFCPFWMRSGLETWLVF